jgi:penicillin-binding protein 1B
MVRDGYIALEQAAAAAAEPLAVSNFDPATESVAPYFIDYVNRHLTAQGEDSFDASAITTLDLDLQQLAVNAVRRQLQHLDQIYRPKGLTPQAALVALDPKTGAVLAMVGGRDYAESQLNRAIDAKRQPGSVFKPFVYAAALETGFSPLKAFKDAPQEFKYAGNQKYRPSNYGGAFSMSEVPMRTGLIKSLNVVTVDVAMQTGLARVANTALKFGLPRPTPYPSLALGTTEVTPLEMAAAYAVFANGGVKIEPEVTVPKVEAATETVIAPGTAFMITDMLAGVLDHGTARGARDILKLAAAAGKTGTSRDGWFVGYTPNLVCAVWVGFDDHKQLGLTGADSALPVWADFMKQAIDRRPEFGGSSFAQPAEIEIAEIDPETKGIATTQCPAHERIALPASEAPTSECFRHNIYFALGSDVNQIDRSAKAQSPVRKSARAVAPAIAAKRETRVDQDRRGRSVLVNEMRIPMR